MRNPHSACHSHKRVTVILRDRTRLEGNFLTRNDRTITLEDGSVIPRAELQAFITNPVQRVNQEKRAVNQAAAAKRQADEVDRRKRRAARKKPRRRS